MEKRERHGVRLFSPLSEHNPSVPKVEPLETQEELRERMRVLALRGVETRRRKAIERRLRAWGLAE